MQAVYEIPIGDDNFVPLSPCCYNPDTNSGFESGSLNGDFLTWSRAMRRTKLLLSACCAAALTAPQMSSQPPPAGHSKLDADYTKKAIELPAKSLISETAPAPRPAVIDTENPWVEPGKVKWHKSFADARIAAELSGKPVLLFQMMGRLDQQFT